MLNPVETEQSKIFPNEAFGYWKVTVERPLKLKVDLSLENMKKFVKTCEDAKDYQLGPLVKDVRDVIGTGPHMNFDLFMDKVEDAAKANNIKLNAKRNGLLKNELAERDENAMPVLKKVYKAGKVEVNPLYGRYQNPAGDKSLIIEYEPDTSLRDTEQIPLLEEGGIQAFIEREVLPYVPDAWVDESKTAIGYEISFTRHFYKPQPLRTLDEIKADILALEEETEGLLEEIIGEA